MPTANDLAQPAPTGSAWEEVAPERRNEMLQALEQQLLKLRALNPPHTYAVDPKAGVLYWIDERRHRALSVVVWVNGNDAFWLLETALQIEIPIDDHWRDRFYVSVRDISAEALPNTAPKEGAC
jgi:hypothetical protein